MILGNDTLGIKVCIGDVSLNFITFLRYLMAQKSDEVKKKAPRLDYFQARRFFVRYMLSQLRRYSDGDMPVCSLKYLPRNDWLEKFSSCAISLMLFCVLRSSIRSSMVT